jgi:hypothetical protein
MPTVTPFKKLFSVSEKQHNSLEGLLRHPVIVGGAFYTGHQARRGQLVRWDKSYSMWAPVVYAKARVENGKLKLSTYDGLTVGDNYKVILSNGTVATVQLTQLVPPVFDPVSTLQTNEDYAVFADPDGAGPLTPNDILYVCPNVADLSTPVDGVVYEDSHGGDGVIPHVATVAVAVELDGAKAEEVYAADTPLAATLGLKVINGLVFFRAR